MNQGLLKATAFVFILNGGVLGLLGLVFLLAPGKTGKGLVMLGLAALLIGFAASRLRSLARRQPAYLEEQVAALAAAGDGSVTMAMVLGHLRVDEATMALIMEALVQRGVARRELRSGAEVYVFAGLKQARMIKRCPYCGNKYPVSQPGRTCPSCGGNMEVVADD